MIGIFILKLFNYAFALGWWWGKGVPQECKISPLLLPMLKYSRLLAAFSCLPAQNGLILVRLVYSPSPYLEFGRVSCNCFCLSLIF